MSESVLDFLDGFPSHFFEKNPPQPVLLSAQYQINIHTFGRLHNEAQLVLRKHDIDEHHIVELCLPRSYQLVVFAIACMSMRVPFFITNPQESNIVLERERNRIKPIATISLEDGYAGETISIFNSCGISVYNDFEHHNWKGISYLARSSGSTGEPKFSKITRNGLINLIHEQARTFMLAPGSVVGLASSVSFDAIFSEIFSSLFNGCSLYILDSRDNALIRSLSDCIEKLTHLTLTPSVAAHLNYESFEKLETLVLVGEPIPQNLLLSIPNNVNVINAYGPCEATVCTHTNRIGRVVDNNVGRAINNISTYIYSDSGDILPAGYSGYVVIGGVGVGAGYVGQTIMSDLMGGYFYGKSGELLFNTSDLGVINKNGELILQGRRDAKVKIRGQQVNLHGIESLVLNMPGVDSAVVEYESDEISLHYTGVISEDDIHELIRCELPKHARPKHCFKHAQLPLSVSGKLDRKKLKELNKTKAANDISAKLFEEVLNKNLADDQDFFEYGGDSLLITELMFNFENKTGQKLDLDKFLDDSTIRGLRSQLGGTSSEQADTHGYISSQFEEELLAIRNIALSSKVNMPIDHSDTLTILLTGGTGIIGREVLSYLSGIERIKVIATARNKKSVAELKSIGATECVELDLGNMELKETFDLLRAKSVTHIIHAAAEVNHIFPIAAIFTPNVKATSVLLQASILASCTQFIYLGSSSAQGEMKNTKSAYDFSKWMAQELVKESSTAIDAKVLTLPLIIGHKSKLTSDRDHMTARIRQCLDMGCYPNDAGHIDVVSAGFIAEMITEIIQRPSIWGSAIEVGSSETVPFDTVLRHAASLTSSSVTEITNEEFIFKLLTWLSDKPACPLAPFSSLYNASSTNYFPAVSTPQEKSIPMQDLYKIAKSSHRSMDVISEYLEEILIN